MGKFMFWEAMAFVVVAVVIAGFVIVFRGEPDMADAWRCKALEIAAKDCK